MNQTEKNIMELGVYTKFKVKICSLLSLHMLISAEGAQLLQNKLEKLLIHFSLPMQ